MKRWFPLLILLALLSTLMLVTTAQQNDNTITATPLSDQVNLRATTFVDSNKVGELTGGETYAVIGRSEFYPWLLLGDAATGETLGWVYETLVDVQGNVNTVPFSDIVVDPAAAPTATLTVPAPQSEASPEASPIDSSVGVTPIDSDQAAASSNPTQAAPMTPTPTATQPFNVAGTVQGEVNVRYGPGVNYQRVGVAQAGERFQITGYHTQLPWVQIRYEDSPTGNAWIAIDLLEIQGNIYTTEPIRIVQNLPTLTPTPSVIQSTSRTDGAATELSSQFLALGNQLWSIVLNNGFDPETSRFGSLFLLDLHTGEAISFGGDIAYRGTSINKVPILARLYGTLNAPPRENLAVDIANTMICSENAATNRLISTIGEGDEWAGAEEITSFLRRLRLDETFLLAPYTVDPNNPPIPPAPIPVPQTEANQQKASPEPYNQMTVEDMGWLLASMYRCAYDESGALLEEFPPGTYEPRECRQMLHTMSSNTVDGLLKAGVPADVRVAHKHGWVSDTHTNAGVFFTEGGDYVLVMALHSEQRDAEGNRYLAFSQSLPVLAETSRTVYNFYNPDAPQPNVREGFIPEAPTCNFAGDPLISDLQLSTWDQ